MSLVLQKGKEVFRTLLPVVIIVLAICFTVVEVETDILIRFLVGSGLLLIGLSIFLWGVDLAMNPIGAQMSREVATSKSPLKIAVLSWLLGFLVTVAEPDLLILGSQIQAASGGTVNATAIVYLISLGVGVLICLGVFRLLREVPLNGFMAVTYGVILVLGLFISEEFLAISFDASGATTGALTTPFVLALSLGLSTLKGGKSEEENAFGLVGIMSAGPILAVMLMSLLTGQKNIHGEAGEYVVTQGILRPMLKALPHTFLESLIALLPLVVLFFAFQFAKFKIPADDLLGIIKGLIFTLIGLTLFLTAVNYGFMDMGRIIGMEIASIDRKLLVVLGFVLGLISVLVEPAVHVLGEQIEQVTSGHIPLSLIRTTLSLGVGMAIAFSMVRIVVPAVKLWYFLLPGFAIAVVLSFIADPVFVGIAYDAGGVASGPMAATFVLAFAQGAATSIETANVLVDGFGVIAMVAMAPVLSIMILGTVFKHKKVEYPAVQKADTARPHLQEEIGIQHDCIVVVVNRGFAEKVVETARNAGAGGATIMRGRGVSEGHKVVLPLIGMELQPEKEIVWLVTGAHVSQGVAGSLLTDEQLQQEGEVVVFLTPTEAMVNAHTAPQHANGNGGKNDTEKA